VKLALVLHSLRHILGAPLKSLSSFQSERDFFCCEEKRCQGLRWIIFSRGLYDAMERHENGDFNAIEKFNVFESRF
jgi:hypothetical protein